MCVAQLGHSHRYQCTCWSETSDKSRSHWLDEILPCTQLHLVLHRQELNSVLQGLDDLPEAEMQELCVCALSLPPSSWIYRLESMTYHLSDHLMLVDACPNQPTAGRR